MPEELALWEVEDLVAQIHQAQRDAAAAMREKEEDPHVQELELEVAKARRALDVAEIRRVEASRKYDERAQLALEEEKHLRARLAEGWPRGEKTIGYASMQTRRSCNLKPTLPAAEAFRKLDALLGATGALPKIVTGIKIDAKGALPLLDAMPALSDVLQVEETRVLAIRQPKEAA